MIQITKATDLGQDVLEVRGFDDANPSTELVATGWMSAMTNYFDPSCYDVNGRMVLGSASRSMTDLEKQAYWKSLLQEQLPSPVVNTSATILFTNPQAQAVLDQAQTTDTAS